MNLTLGVVVALISIFWVLLEGEVARRDGMLTIAQMKHKYPEHKIGLPFLAFWNVGGFIYYHSTYWMTRYFLW